MWMVFALVASALPTHAQATGPTILIQENFEDGSFSARGWYDGFGTTLLSSTEHAPGSTRSGEFRYNQGQVTVSANEIARHKFPETDSIYLAYWVKYSANWVGSGMPYHPHEFHFTTNVDNNDYQGPSMSHLTVYVEQTNGYPILATQDSLNIDTTRLNQDLSAVTENRAVSGCNGLQAVASASCYILVDAWANGRGWSPPEPYFSNSAGPRYKADWHRIEMYVKLNSIIGGKGVPDGIAQYFYDGQSIINRGDVIFRTAQHPNMKFNQFMFLPYIGDRSPVTQTIWVDDLIVATGRPSGTIPPPTNPPPPPPPSTVPGTVLDLSVSQIGSTSVALSFTQVSDGAGQPAKYDVRLGVGTGQWGSKTSVTQGTCATPLQGTGTSGTLTCTVNGLTPATNYEFQMIAFRGTMNQGAVYGGLSSVASATTSIGQTFAPTDVNKDGAINITDVQLGINQALGLSACSSGDANGDGACTILDVQKIVNAALNL